MTELSGWCYTKEDLLKSWGAYLEQNESRFGVDMFILATDYNTSKRYNIFSGTPAELEQFILSQPPTDRHLYEMGWIYGGQKAERIKFDIDIPTPSPQEVADYKDGSLLYLLLKKVSDTFTLTFMHKGKHQLSPKDITVCDSSTASKISFHLTLPYAMSSNKQVKAFIERCKSIKGWDGAPYGQFQQFRLTHCSKINKTNTKRLASASATFSDTLFTHTRTPQGELLTMLPDIWSPPAPLPQYTDDSEMDDLSDDRVISLFQLVKQAVDGKYSSLCNEAGEVAYETFKRLILVAKSAGLPFGEFHEYVLPLYRNWEQYDDGKKWESDYERASADQITIGSLYHYAMENPNFATVFPRDFPHRRLCIPKSKRFIGGTYEEINNEQYIRPFTSTHKVNVIEGAMGKGKSYAMIQYIQGLPPTTSILIPTSRRTFAKSMQKRLKEAGLDIHLYSDDVKSTPSRLICQVESLHHFKQQSFDYIFIDECTSVLSQLTAYKTQKDTILSNQTAFRGFLSHAKNIFCMDAFITGAVLQFFTDLGMRFHFSHYTDKMEARTYSQVPALEALVQRMVDDVKAGKKLFVYSSSVVKLEQLIVPTIHKECPGKKILVYSSKSKQSIVEFKKDWKAADVVLCTSSITIGINFDEANVFDACYMYISAASQNNIRDIFQWHMRVRFLKDKHLTIYLDPRPIGVSSALSKRDIREKVAIEEGLLKSVCKDLYVDMGNTYKNLYVNNTYERAMSTLCSQKVLDAYLSDCNYTKRVEDGGVDKDFTLTAQPKIVLDYEDIPSINSDEYKEIRAKEVKTDFERAMVEKFFFQYAILKVKKEDEEALWELYIDRGRNKFSNIRFEKMVEANERVNFEALLQVWKREYSVYGDPTIVKYTIIKRVCDLIGADNSSFSELVQEACLDGLPDDEVEQWRKVFNVRKSQAKKLNKSKENARVINEVLQKWGYSSFKQVRGGKRKLKGYQVSERKAEVYRHIKPHKVEMDVDTTDLDDAWAKTKEAQEKAE